MFKVYNELGPGFLEKIYKRAVLEELKENRIPYKTEEKFKTFYKGRLIGYSQLDLIAWNKIMLELKAVNKLEKFHLSQVLAYLKAARLKLGLLVNFSSENLEIKRVINQRSKISA